MAKQMTEGQLLEFIRLVEEENKTSEVAAEAVGIKPGSIRNVLRDSGYHVRTRRFVEPIQPVAIPQVEVK